MDQLKKCMCCCKKNHSPESSHRHVSGQTSAVTTAYLERAFPLLPVVGRESTTALMIWKKSTKKRVTQKLPQGCVLAHCLVQYKRKHLQGFCVVGLKEGVSWQVCQNAKWSWYWKRQMVNTPAWPSSVLWHHSHYMTFVDLTRLWPEIQTQKTQCLLNFCFLFTLSQRPRPRGMKLLILKPSCTWVHS